MKLEKRLSITETRFSNLVFLTCKTILDDSRERLTSKLAFDNHQLGEHDLSRDKLLPQGYLVVTLETKDYVDREEYDLFIHTIGHLEEQERSYVGPSKIKNLLPIFTIFLSSDEGVPIDGLPEEISDSFYLLRLKITEKEYDELRKLPERTMMGAKFRYSNSANSYFER